jgi:GNAT superfamily N-acetyltransferase
MTMKGVWVDVRHLQKPNEELALEGRFLESAEVIELARSSACPGSGFTEDIVRTLLANGDECFGILDGVRLAAFCWYSRNAPTLLNENWVVHFDPSCVYVYFVYTDVAYRGRRLLAHGIQHAAQEYLRQGCRKILAFVESANYNSLNSFYRMGFKNFGMIRTAKPFGKHLAHHSRGCERFAFRVTPNATAATRLESDRSPAPRRLKPT